jgi:hypothetical protein
LCAANLNGVAVVQHLERDDWLAVHAQPIARQVNEHRKFSYDGTRDDGVLRGRAVICRQHQLVPRGVRPDAQFRTEFVFPVQPIFSSINNNGHINLRFSG